MDYRFADIADIPGLQQMLVSFQAASGIPAEIVDLASETIVASSAARIGESLHERARGDEQILSSNDNVYLRRYEQDGGRFTYARVLRLGDRDIADVLIGPVIHEAHNVGDVHERHIEPGFGETVPLKAVAKTPVITEDQIYHHAVFLTQVLQQMLEQRVAILQLQERLALSQSQEEKLQGAYEEIESRILERTEELQRTNKSLQESEQRFRVALVDTPIIVFNQDRDLRYTWVYNLKGYTDQSIIGKTDADLYSVEDAARLTTLKRRVMAAGLLTREEVAVTVGSEKVYYDMTLDPLFDESGNVVGITCAATDITERKQMYEQLQRSLAESESVQRIARGLLQKIGLDEVLKIVCEEAMRLTGATGSAVLLLEGDNWLQLTHSEGVPRFPFERLPIAASFAGQAFQSGSYVWVNTMEIGLEEAADKLQGYPWIPGVKSLFVVPLRAETKVIGVINILDKPGQLTQEDIRIINLFADQAAIIIEHVRLQAQAEQLAVLEERQRIARELHDSVTQALYSVTLYADAARMAFSAKKWDALESNLQEVRNMAREAMYDMRLLVFELRPFMLETEGLVSVLRARLAAVEDRAGLKTLVEVEGERRLPISIEEELYRIAQEGLNNVVKHAAARQVRIHLQYEQDSVLFEMVDDGRGFDPASADQSGGFGLQGIKERVERLAGSLEIESAPGQGTRLSVRVPTTGIELEQDWRRVT